MRARVLTIDETVDIVVTGNHAQAGSGSIPLDAGFIDLIRSGELKAALSWDNRLLIWSGANPDPIFDPIEGD